MIDERFKTQYDLHSRYFTNNGSRMKKEYIPQFDQFGNFDLVETGEVSLYDYIQSHKDSVDIHVIMSRFANGDVGALTKVQGAYGDFTNVPTTYADLLNKVLAAQRMFDSLSLEEKEKYGMSMEKWLFSREQETDAKQLSPEAAKPKIDMDLINEIINMKPEGEEK